MDARWLVLPASLRPFLLARGIDPSRGIRRLGENSVRSLIGATEVLQRNYSEVLAVHAALLHTNQILYFSGDETDAGFLASKQFNHTRLFDCTTLQIQSCSSPTTDVFCVGHAYLADGRLLAAGGIEQYPIGEPSWHHGHAPGLRFTWIFDPETTRWTQVATMAGGPLRSPTSPGGPPDAAKTGGRWYPTLVTLASGEILAMSGHPGSSDARHINNTPEIFSIFPLPSGRWKLMSAVGGVDIDPFQNTYPRLHLLPSGKVFSATPLDENFKSHLYDPVTGELSDVCDAAPGYTAAGKTSVLLPLLPEEGYRVQILLCGLEQAFTIELPFNIDPNAPPAWRPSSPRVLPGSPVRTHVNSVLLPTGEVFICGGIRPGGDPNPLDDSGAVLEPELYQPQTASWVALATSRAHIARNYHSVALLMPDGRVWTAGSNRNSILGAANANHYIEIFEPWYCFVERPKVISEQASLGTVTFRQQFEVRFTSIDPIKAVAMIRTGSVTHSFNSDQRYIGVEFTHSGGDRLNIVAPPNASIAPPGYYLLFVINQAGVPSVGTLLRLSLPPSLRQFLLARGIDPSRGIRSLGFNSVRTLMGV